MRTRMRWRQLRCYNCGCRWSYKKAKPVYVKDAPEPLRTAGYVCELCGVMWLGVPPGKSVADLLSPIHPQIDSVSDVSAGQKGGGGGI